MTLDPKSKLFQDAIKITGRAYLTSAYVKGCRDELEFCRGEWRWRVCSGTATQPGREAEELTVGTPPTSPAVAECAHEHHFRVWMEENAEGVGVRRRSGGGYFAWLTSVGWLCFVHGDTYLECQMKAVVEIDKSKTAPCKKL